MNQIIVEQNKTFYIDRLAAQRHLYTQCKWINSLHFCLSVCAVISLAFVKIASDVSDTCLNYIALYSIIMAIINPWMIQIVHSKQLLAARIQQWLDTDLFKLQWDDALCGPKPDAGEVYMAMKGQKKDGLKDWYVPAEISQLSHENAVIVCMRENVYYDKKLRERYKWLSLFSFVVCILLIFAVALFNNISTWDIILKELLPLLPLYNWFISVFKQNSCDIRQVQDVQSLLIHLIEKAKTGAVLTKEDLCKMQNFIFQHRKGCYVIPDTLYNLIRKGIEQEVSYDINTLIKELN